MILKKVLSKLPSHVAYTLIGDDEVEFRKIQSDSRNVNAGDLFIAIKGFTVDGHNYVDAVIDKDIRVLVVEDRNLVFPPSLTRIVVKDTSEFLGYLASAYYDNPSTKLNLVGVTGTNGKSTVVTLLYNLFRKLGHNVGLISTIENRINDDVSAAKLTTPDALALNVLLSEMVEKSCEYVFMEVSSHAIAQSRIAGQQYVGGLFTNITHDHLDYHKDFKEYLWAKKKFFDMLPESAFALTNVDDKNGEVMLQNCKAKKYKYSLRTLTDYKGKLIKSDLNGMLISINEDEVYSRLVGEFNAYNILTVYATSIILEQEKEDVLTAISDLKTASGRFEVIRVQGKDVIGIVDYAHTPDALLNVLKTIKDTSGKIKLITVVGCGGDRDTKKRPIMAKIACEYSDRVILTSDNPRSEDPDEIIRQMQEGVDKKYQPKVLKITNREDAIKTATMIASEKSVILVAGKGHEKTQEIRGEKFPFDDGIILKAFLREE